MRRIAVPCLIAAAVCLAAGFLLQLTEAAAIAGRLAAGIAFVLGGVGCLLLGLASLRDPGGRHSGILFLAGAVFCFFVGIRGTACFAADMATGPVHASVTVEKVTMRQSVLGTVTQYVFRCRKNNGKSLRFRVTARQYFAWNGYEGETVEITYWENSSVLVSMTGSAG